MQMKFVLSSPAKPRSPLRKLVTLIVTVAMVGLALMFSAVLLALIVIVGSIAGVYLWWKTREVRKMMRMMRSFSTPEVRREAQASNDGVFEGEVIRVVEPPNGK